MKKIFFFFLYYRFCFPPSFPSFSLGGWQKVGGGGGGGGEFGRISSGD
ncbi:hypothetical protein MOQ_001699, partial [Trypanosoma cruzi marinkellei]